MAPEYVHLRPGEPPPPLEGLPYRAILIAEQAVSQSWRHEIAAWLVGSGCLYCMAWGVDCEIWHDDVDWTNIAAFDFAEIPPENFIMTTWHTTESLAEVFWFAANCAAHPDIDLERTIVVDVAQDAHEAHILSLFRDSEGVNDQI